MSDVVKVSYTVNVPAAVNFITANIMIGTAPFCDGCGMRFSHRVGAPPPLRYVDSNRAIGPHGCV